MIHIRTRFNGEVVELGRVRDSKTNALRAIRFGDQVKAGQLLAVIWSRELGEVKCDLLAVLAELRVDKERLRQLESLATKGAVSKHQVSAASFRVEKGEIAAARLDRTLRTWRISEPVIESLHAEARDTKSRGKMLAAENGKVWGRIEILSPIDGTILEQNAASEYLVTPRTDMFMIADLSRLGVVAHVYEDDIADLESLPAEQRLWKVFVTASPTRAPLRGAYSRVGDLVDPREHVASIMGWVENTDGSLRAGQFIRAEIEIPGRSAERRETDCGRSRRAD